MDWAPRLEIRNWRHQSSNEVIGSNISLEFDVNRRRASRVSAQTLCVK